jgi:hypothetical protein
MSGCTSVSTAACFIDLATFSELESFMYGGPHAISYFVAGVQKANWFSIIPIQLRDNGCFDFGSECVSSSINRSGDYVINTWFRAEIPTIAYTLNTLAAGNSVRWTRNLMHNLIKRVTLTFNELIVEEFDHYWLDFNVAYRIHNNKKVAYNNMIGNIPSLTTAIPVTANINNGLNTTLSGGALFGGHFSVPIPWFFGEDTGIALPIAALPFNDVKANYEFRCLEDLLVFQGPNNYTISDISTLHAEFSSTTGQYTYTINSTKSFKNGHTHAHYAVVHNDERTKMGDAPRDILIRQVQTICGCDVVTGHCEHCFDLRLSHGIVNMFWALRNKTVKGEWSNYTTNFNFGVASSIVNPVQQPQIPGAGIWYNPIHQTTVCYENTIRLDFHSDFYALIHPYFFSEGVSEDTGMHMWTYSPGKAWDPLSPCGSTNYSKLANVQMRHKLSHRAIYYLNHPLLVVGETTVVGNLKLHNVFLAQNWNIARVANGSLGHPTL